MRTFAAIGVTLILLAGCENDVEVVQGDPIRIACANEVLERTERGQYTRPGLEGYNQDIEDCIRANQD